MSGTLDATITIRTTKETKEKANSLFRSMGMDTSTAINTFLNQSIRDEALPFRPNRVTRKAISDMEQRKNISGPFDTVEELMESLNT